MDLAAFLKGAWRWQRIINDRAGGFDSTADGTATWLEQGPSRLLYTEEGIVRHSTHVGPCFQSYIYDIHPLHRIDLSFASGRAFVQLDLQNGASAAQHLCGDDTYNGLFTIMADDRLRIEWRVTGPRKDYSLDTLYSKIAA